MTGTMITPGAEAGHPAHRGGDERGCGQQQPAERVGHQAPIDPTPRPERMAG
jgi:hypothetical protein